MIQRDVISSLRSEFHGSTAVVILGARHVEKTTAIENMLNPDEFKNVLYFNGDDVDTRLFFDKPSLVKLQNFIAKHRVVFIDEAQRIKDIGFVLKIIVDRIKNVQLFISGSSALELVNEINEPFTGRRVDYRMHPISFSELVRHHSLFTETRNLSQRLIYGSYPGVLEKSLLSHLAGSYLYKDLLNFEKIKKPRVLDKLIQAIALQIGSEVSYNEPSQLVGIHKETVERYIDLLEKAFVVFKLNAYSRNVRNEIKKAKKIYFYNNGIRNAIRGNYSPIETLTDVGALWKNYIIRERQKYNSARGFYGRCYFWSTTQQQEVDYLEEVDGNLSAYEFKWNTKKNSTLSKNYY